MIRNAMCDNDWTPPAAYYVKSPSISNGDWEHQTLTTPYPITGEKWYIDGKYESKLKPNVEFYCLIKPGKTGTFDFDIKNIVVYDETDKKYLPSISDGVKAGTTVEIKDTDATVTAVWAPNTYTVHYDITDSETTIPDQTFIFDNPNGDTISKIKPVRKGYTFAGWRYDDTEDSSYFRLFNPGNKIPSGYGDFTLHAMWVANGYHVTFEGNGADSGTMSDEAFTYDDNAKSLTANSFARNGYRFVGWNTKVDGSGQSYSDAQAVKNLSEGGETILVNTDSLQFNQIRNDSNSTSFINTSVKDLNSLTSGVVYSTTVTNTSYESGGVYSLPLDNFTSDFKTFFADKKMNISFKARSDKPMSINKVGFESASGQKQISLNNQWDTYSITAKMNSSITNRHALIFYSAQQTGTYYVGDLNVTMGGEVKLYAQWEKLTDIAIINTVSGNMGNKSKDFTYTLQFPSSFNGTKLTVVDGNGSPSTVTIGSDCKLSFTLKHGQSYTIKELTEAQFNSIKGLTNYGISETNYAEEGYKTSSTTKMDAHGNIQLIFNNQSGSVLPTGIILAGSGMGIIVALVIALGWLIKHKFIH